MNLSVDFGDLREKLKKDKYLYLRLDSHPLTQDKLKEIDSIASNLDYEEVLDGDAGDKHNLLVGRLRNDIDLPEDCSNYMPQVDLIINNEQMQQFYKGITGFGNVCIRRCQVNRLKVGNFVGLHSDMQGDPDKPDSHLGYQFAIVVHIDSYQQQGGETILHFADEVKRINIEPGAMLITDGNLLHEVTRISKGYRETLVYFLSDNFGFRRESCLYNDQLLSFKHELLHQSMVFPKKEIPFTESEWQILRRISSDVNYEKVTLSNAGDTHEIFVSRVVYDQFKDYKPKLMNTKIAPEILSVLLSEKMRAFYKEIIGSDQFIMPRCQFTILEKGGFISEHLDTDTNPHYYASIVLHFSSGYTGGSYTYTNYLRDAEVELKTKENSMVVALSSRFPHYVQAMEGGERRTLTYFLSFPYCQMDL
ncbi:2OG-Fe(II) oxygenase [Microbulbifer variabilis]|uniref:2OG-Fe(II) oxygenase n=1 Tax=Microbulbifer variabilis TaxID=266805 RepID=UPI0003691901|nr:2OG-Fe(II) oxygenase [Microbulbifer variabilis]